MIHSKLRTWSNGRLVTWSQNRCVKCQRFLTKKELKYCPKHAKEQARLDGNKAVIKYRLKNEGIFHV
jgi:hypothetical protein